MTLGRRILAEEQALLYLRREPTGDAVLLDWAPDAAIERRDVVAYEDAAMTRIRRRWPWFYTFSKPRRFRKRIRIDGIVYGVVWHPDLPAD